MQHLNETTNILISLMESIDINILKIWLEIDVLFLRLFDERICWDSTQTESGGYSFHSLIDGNVALYYQGASSVLRRKVTNRGLSYSTVDDNEHKYRGMQS